MKLLYKAVAVSFVVMSMASVAQAKDMKQGSKKWGNADTNADGVISRQEFIAKAEKRFQTMDGNNDGVITRDEAEVHRKKMREQFAERNKAFMEESAKAEAEGK